MPLVFDSDLNRSLSGRMPCSYPLDRARFLRKHAPRKPALLGEFGLVELLDIDCDLVLALFEPVFQIGLGPCIICLECAKRVCLLLDVCLHLLVHPRVLDGQGNGHGQRLTLADPDRRKRRGSARLTDQDDACHPVIMFEGLDDQWARLLAAQQLVHVGCVAAFARSKNDWLVSGDGMLDRRVISALEGLLARGGLGRLVLDGKLERPLVARIDKSQCAQVGLQCLRDTAHCILKDGTQIERRRHLLVGVEQVHQPSDLCQRLLVHGL